MSTPQAKQQPQKQPAQPPSLQQKLQFAQAQRDRWSKVAADPNLSLGAALLARQAARSYAAAATLGEKALANSQAENDPASQSLLMRALGISPLLPDQSPTSAPQGPPPSSTGPETSA